VERLAPKRYSPLGLEFYPGEPLLQRLVQLELVCFRRLRDKLGAVEPLLTSLVNLFNDHSAVAALLTPNLEYSRQVASEGLI